METVEIDDEFEPIEETDSSGEEGEESEPAANVDPGFRTALEVALNCKKSDDDTVIIKTKLGLMFACNIVIKVFTHIIEYMLHRKISKQTWVHPCALTVCNRRPNQDSLNLDNTIFNITALNMVSSRFRLSTCVVKQTHR